MFFALLFVFGLGLFARMVYNRLVFCRRLRRFLEQVGNARHYSFSGAVFARCAKQALLNRHDFFFWKMAVDVAVVSCLSGLPDSPLSKRRRPGCSPNHSPQEGAWLRSFQPAARFASNFRSVPSTIPRERQKHTSHPEPRWWRKPPKRCVEN